MRAALPLLALCAAFASAPAMAQSVGGTRAVLVDSSRAPMRATIVDGASWRCEGTACTASGGANQPAARACRRVVARFGAVSSFSWKGEALTAEQLAVCNA